MPEYVPTRANPIDRTGQIAPAVSNSCVMEYLGDVKMKLEVLERDVETLFHRMTPVMTPMDNEPAPAKADGKYPGGSLLASELFALSCRIDGVDTHVTKMINHLDV